MTISGNKCKEIAQYMLDNKCTVRTAASHFKYSKTTVYNAITCDLFEQDNELYVQICGLLENNRNDRARRGGLARQRKLREG